MTQLYPFQERGVRRIRRHGGRVLLGDEMGLGKTIQVLTYAKEEDIRPIVVVCPAGLKYHWEGEAAKHCRIKAEVLNGTKIPRGRLTSPRRMVIVNYDILGSWLEFLKRMRPQLVIADEGHFLKNPKAKRTKNFKVLALGVPRIIIATGTAIVNRPSELFAIVNILWPTEFPHYWPFAHRYCKPRRRPWGWEAKGAARLPELHGRLKSLGMIRRLKRKVLHELPDKIVTVLPVDLSSHKEYRECETEFVGWLAKHFGKRRADKAAMAERLVRFGYLKRLAARLKIPACIEWIDNFLEATDEKLIVFGIHKFFIAALLDRYRKISVKVDGSVTGRDRQRAVEQFQRSKRTRLFIGQVVAAGNGWDGSCASSVGILELPWTPGEVSQCIDRPHRIGQKNTVNATFLVARNTVEVELCDLLQKKQDVLSKLLDGDSSGKSLNIMDLLTRSLLRKQ